MSKKKETPSPTPRPAAKKAAAAQASESAPTPASVPAPASASVPAAVPDNGQLSPLQRVQRSFLDHMKFTLAKNPPTWTRFDHYHSLALAVRDRLVERWMATHRTHYEKDVKRVYYLSLEYLLGRALGNNMLNLGLFEACHKAMEELGLSLSDVLEQEVDAGLGNGGLGRLAACFLDSLATLSIPAMGYGIRYEFGIFEQEIRNGFQVEKPEEWLRFPNPWEIERPEYTTMVRFGGRTEHRPTEGRLRVQWLDTESVLGVPYDMPIAGYGNNTVNTLRLWQARASKEFNLDLFNYGNYILAVEEKNLSENISKVLYPNDRIAAGKELRFKQQYFFVSCSLQDIVRRYKTMHSSFEEFPDKVAIQLNDTHPSLAIPELMRLLVDVELLPWDKAWDLCTRAFGYTNHTLMPEALEMWPVEMFERFLPRHLEIIYEINRRFLRVVLNKFPMDTGRVERMSLIQEKPTRQVRMAYLAIAGSHSINGVSALHTELLKSGLVRDFHELWPERFNNKTNGVTQRRWLALSNPGLARLITESIGDAWTTNLYELRKLAPLAEDPFFRARFRAVKAENKARLAKLIHQTLELRVDPASLFDVQVKRLHEYKRQLLNVLHIIALYRRAKRDPDSIGVPRTFLFGAKAAPGYEMAKLIIKLVHAVGEVVNEDEDIAGRLRVVFLPNYRVSLAETIIPAADLSEQISTAGLEASGTGNMKFSMNGALTIGTLDGANIEIREEVGAENFFLFGLKADEVAGLKRSGYNPMHVYRQNAELRDVLDFIASGFFSPEQRNLFEPVLHTLLHGGDPFMVLADFAAYLECQEQVSRLYQDPEEWSRKAILNVAAMGKFSSDRTIREYAEEIWDIQPVPIEL
jgi:starch phosphorylase